MSYLDEYRAAYADDADNQRPAPKPEFTISPEMWEAIEDAKEAYDVVEFEEYEEPDDGIAW